MNKKTISLIMTLISFIIFFALITLYTIFVYQRGFIFDTVYPIVGTAIFFLIYLAAMFFPNITIKIIHSFLTKLYKNNSDMLTSLGVLCEAKRRFLRRRWFILMACNFIFFAAICEYL